MFNGLLRTHLGPVEDESGLAYLRPETAQGIFINYRNVLQTSRRKLPFGIGQIGKSFRNEITPGNFIFRTLEFEQMEMEFFVRPGTDEQWHQTWIDTRFAWYTDLGIRPENLRLYEHPKDKLSHYSKRIPGSPGTPISVSARRTCGCTSTPRTSCRTTPSGRWTSSTGSTSPAANGVSSRASPTAPTSTSRRTRRRPSRT